MKHMEEYPDEELIDMYRAGNEQAIEYIFERYKYIVRKKAKAMFLAGGDSDPDRSSRCNFRMVSSSTARFDVRATPV